MQRKKQDSIDELKESLYSRDNAPKVNPDIRTPLSHDYAEHPPVAWQDAKIDPPAPQPLQTMTTKKRLSFAAKFFIFSTLFFFVAAGITAYTFFYGVNTVSPQNIDLEVIAPSVSDGGKQVTFEVIIDNRNKTPLNLADLIIQYPDGARDPANQDNPLVSNRLSIGTIEPNQQIKRTVSAVLYGQEGATQKLSATLEYSVPSSNSIFQKTGEADFTIGSSPVSISVNAPQEAIAGQSFGVDVTLTSNAQTPIDNVVLQAQYPFGFTVASTNPQADTGGTIWRLGTLAPGQSKTVHFTGSIDGQDGDERVFRFLTGTIADPTNTVIKVPYIIVPQSITVHRPFVSALLALNGSSGKSVSIPGSQTVNGAVTWQNNLTVPVSNVELKLTLAGPMLDKSSVQAGSGFYQSQDSTIVWTKDTDSTLAEVPPGGTGSLQFSFSTLAPGSGGTVYTNPTINLNLEVAGIREGQSGVPETVSSAASMDASIASAVNLKIAALHFTGPFTNTGPMPPVAESRTTYSVVWTVSNASNAIANASVSATLPSYVDFVAAAPGSGITYDAPSRTVTWDIGDVKAGVGYSSRALSGAFQVSLLPSATQVGESPQLTSDTVFHGQDRFAQVSVQTSASGPSTLLSGDGSFQPSMATVAPKQ